MSDKSEFNESSLIEADIAELDKSNPNWRDAYAVNGALMMLRDGRQEEITTRAYGADALAIAKLVKPLSSHDHT